jgi:hypothetical protein
MCGTAPVTIGAGHIALRDKEGAIQTSSGGALTFSGRPTMTIPRAPWCTAIR